MIKFLTLNYKKRKYLYGFIHKIKKKNYNKFGININNNFLFNEKIQ